MSTAAKQWTMQDLLDMPDDGVRRWIINGQLREEKMDTGEFGGQVMTVRNRFHSEMMANITTVVNVWRYSLPQPRGRVVCGEAGVLLPGGPENAVGVDMAYVPPDVMIQQTDETTVIHARGADVDRRDRVAEHDRAVDQRAGPHLPPGRGAAGVGDRPGPPHRDDPPPGCPHGGGE